MSARPAAEAALSTTMRAVQDGDAAAYRILLRDCVPLIAAVARGQGIRGALVDDVVQETLLTMHRARATYDPGRPFLPWLRAIAQRRSVDAIRRGARRPREVYDPIAYEAEADLGPAPGHAIEAGQRAQHLASAVARLPEGQRQAIEHLGFRELSLDETAALTGRTKGALKVNFHRALKALRAALSTGKEGGDV